MNENAIKTFSPSRVRGLFACALALALGTAVLVPLLAFGAGTWEKPLADLRSPDGGVREAAIKRLAAGGEGVLPDLLDWMSSAGRYALAAQVGIAIGRPAVPGLVALLGHPDRGSRAGELLFQIARPEVSAELPGVLACTRIPALREVCGRALVKLMSPKGGRHLPALAEGLKDGDPAVRAYCAAALGQLGVKGRGAVRPLVEALKDPAPTVRLSAAASLGKIGRKAASAVPALEAASIDSDGEVSRFAAEALKRIRDGR